MSLQRSAGASPSPKTIGATFDVSERLGSAYRTLMLPSVWRNARRGYEDHPSNQSRAV